MFQSKIPNGYILKDNQSSNWECGYHAMRDAFVGQYPSLEPPSLEELKLHCKKFMPAWTKLNDALPKGETLELNYLTVDQMAVVFHSWAEETSLVMQFGYIMYDDGMNYDIPVLSYHPLEDIVTIKDTLCVHLEADHYRAPMPKKALGGFDILDTATEMTPEEAEDEFSDSQDDDSESEESTSDISKGPAGAAEDGLGKPPSDSESVVSTSGIPNEPAGEAETGLVDPPSDSESMASSVSTIPIKPKGYKKKKLPKWISDDPLADDDTINLPIPTALPAPHVASPQGTATAGSVDSTVFVDSTIMSKEEWGKKMDALIWDW